MLQKLRSKITPKSKSVLLSLIPFLLILFVVLILISYLAHHSSNTNTAVFTIDGRNYSKSEVLKLIKYPPVLGLSNDALARDAYTALKEIRTAKKLGYEPSQSDINDQKDKLDVYQKLTDSQKATYNDWFTLTATQYAVHANISTGSPFGYAGYSYVFYFGQHSVPILDFTVPDLNNATLIAQDKGYAKQKADFYYDQLKNNKMSPKQALDLSGKDMQSKVQGITNPNYSKDFTALSHMDWGSQVYLLPVATYISSLNKTGLSDMKTGALNIQIDKSNYKKIVSYYYFVFLTAVPTTKSIDSHDFYIAYKAMPSTYRGFK